MSNKKEQQQKQHWHCCKKLISHKLPGKHAAAGAIAAAIASAVSALHSASGLTHCSKGGDAFILHPCRMMITLFHPPPSSSAWQTDKPQCSRMLCKGCTQYPSTAAHLISNQATGQLLNFKVNFRYFWDSMWEMDWTAEKTLHLKWSDHCCPESRRERAHRLRVILLGRDSSFERNVNCKNVHRSAQFASTATEHPPSTIPSSASASSSTSLAVARRR